MALSRRALLATSATGLAIGTLQFAGAAPASAAAIRTGGKGQPIVADRRSLSFNFFSTDWATHYALQYPVYLEISDGSDGGAGFTAEFNFDPRIFEPNSEVALFDNTSVTVVPTEISSLGDGSSSLRFTLEHGLGPAAAGNSISFGLPLALRDLYPAENVGPILPLTLSLSPTGGGAPSRTQWIPLPKAVNVLPWGIELSAGWSELKVTQGGKELVYRAPMLIRVDSVGPSSVPAGTVLTVVTDRRIVASLGVKSVVLDNVVAPELIVSSSAKSEDALQLEIVLGQELAAGSALEVWLQSTPVAEAPKVSSIRFTSVTATNPADLTRPERSTGKQSIVDFTSSGSPLASDIAEGTI